MALKIEKKERETTQSVIRRFSRAIKGSGILKEARKRRFFQKELNDTARKAAALRRIRSLSLIHIWMITGRVADRINLLCLSPGTTSESDFREWIRFTDSLSSFYFNEGLQEEINLYLEDLGFGVDYLTL